MVYKCLHHFKTHILTACNAGDQPHLAPAFHGLLRGAAHGYDRKAAAATIALGAAATSAQGFRCSGWGLRWGLGQLQMQTIPNSDLGPIYHVHGITYAYLGMISRNMILATAVEAPPSAAQALCAGRQPELASSSNHRDATSTGRPWLARLRLVAALGPKDP